MLRRPSLEHHSVSLHTYSGESRTMGIRRSRTASRRTLQGQHDAGAYRSLGDTDINGFVPLEGGYQVKGLRLTELYSSIQGEGPRMGAVTSFVRFGGCNMRCAGWPCDTPHAILPEIWKHDPIVPPDYIVKKVRDLPGKNVCITGGEPTLQPLEDLEKLGTQLLLEDYTVDVFSNGSLKPFPLWMLMEPSVCIIMDWKLAGSGENQTGMEVRIQNARALTSKDALKFVIVDDMDFESAMFIWKSLGELKCSIWAGVAWGRYSEADLIERIKAARVPWRMNIQLHKFIYPGVDKGI